MQFNSVKGSNFTSAAKALNKSTEAIFAASRASAPNFTNISKAAIKSRSAERQAVDKAKGLTDLAEIKADSMTDLTKIRSKTSEDVADIKRPAQRMAGVVGGLGALSGYAIMAKNAREDDEAAERMEDLYAARTKELTAAIKASQSEPFVPGTYEGKPYTPLPSTPSTSSDTSNSSSSSESSQSIASYERQTLTQPQMKQLLMDQGMDEANATIGAAVGMAESSGKSWALNPNTDHEYSLGVWQHNRDTNEDRHDFYGIKDWSELADPVTNARATYRLWKRAGGTWGDWGAYTNESYKEFL